MSKRHTDRSVAAPTESDSVLSLEDTIAQIKRGLEVRSHTGQSGYNPYNAVPPPAHGASAPSTGRANHAHASTDLRKLSEWIRLSREVAALKKDGRD
ncbi:MAG: hypothetical protein ACHP9W_05485 [Steroidobacterales bacterium]